MSCSLNALNHPQWIAHQLRVHFPEAEVTVHRPRNDDCHLAVTVIDEVFRGKTRIQCHQLIYGALDNMRNGAIHALSIEARTP